MKVALTMDVKRSSVSSGRLLAALLLAGGIACGLAVSRIGFKAHPRT